jgi:hypothetical protein
MAHLTGLEPAVSSVQGWCFLQHPFDAASSATRSAPDALEEQRVGVSDSSASHRCHIAS